MHFNSLALASLALVPFIEAHGDGIPGAPKIFGRRSAMKVERKLAAEPMQKRTIIDSMDKRQAGNTDGQCGQGFGNCASGYCCSEAGWCGKGTEYCSAPGCQFNFGTGCDDNTVPSGTSTANIARPKVGNVLYGGAGIYDCEVAGTIAITYDDGPYIYTEHILDLLKQYNAKATFFITGNNNGKGQIDNAALPWAATVKRTYNEGHQVASHTWSHPHLSNLTSAQRKQNMVSNEMALRNILGVFPTYMRPPYSDCTEESGCQQDMADLGYHVSYFDIDTDDYNNDSPALIQNAKNNFDAGVRGGKPATDDYLVIGHDIHQQTAYNLTEYMLQKIQSLGYKAVTMGECMGDPKENWYRKSDGSVFTSATNAVSSTTSSAVPAPTSTSPDGTCGGTTGFTCKGSAFGDCCSPAGWCGSGTLYCGEGCQNTFGTCGINVPVTGTTTTNPVATAAPTAVSTDATCGQSGFTCQGSVFGNCCSVNGWCGSTEAYCGTGCQSGFGSCGNGGGVKANPAIVSSNSDATLATRAINTVKAVTISTKATQAATATKATSTASATPTQKSSFSEWFHGLFNKAFHH